MPHRAIESEVFMRIEAIKHVQLAMPLDEEAAARRFYAGILEIPEVQKPPHLTKRAGCWFEREPLKVHLGVQPNFQPATKAHLAFTVSGLASLIRRLSEAGISGDIRLFGKGTGR